MKKKILAMIMVFLFIGGNLYAAGDLIVNGNLGVGTSTPATKLDVVGKVKISDTMVSGSGAGVQNPLWITAIAGNSFAYPGLRAINALAKSLPSTSAELTGFYMQAQHETNQNTNNLEGGYFLVQYRSDAATTVTRSAGLHLLHSKSNISAGYTSVTDGYGLLSEVRDEPSSGTLNFNSYKHLYLMNPDAAIVATNLSGLWIDQQTEGTNNYGIVLNGDGAGSDIVFGPTHNARIYSSAGRLYAQDSFDNQTILSPHDPDTGEWIYYSKNVKTGKVVRVNMEQLVKAVEKLTGEKFMIETLEE